MIKPATLSCEKDPQYSYTPEIGFGRCCRDNFVVKPTSGRFSQTRIVSCLSPLLFRPCESRQRISENGFGTILCVSGPQRKQQRIVLATAGLEEDFGGHCRNSVVAGVLYATILCVVINV
eukprot:scaffold6330_cov76-Amphora_coffeaeformis.AAC.2